MDYCDAVIGTTPMCVTVVWWLVSGILLGLTLLSRVVGVWESYEGYSDVDLISGVWDACVGYCGVVVDVQDSYVGYCGVVVCLGLLCG